MLKLNGSVRVRGTIDISEKALARLAEMGVKPPKNPYPQGGEYDSFYLPEGEDGAEFRQRRGLPMVAASLKLASEFASDEECWQGRLG